MTRELEHIICSVMHSMEMLKLDLDTLERELRGKPIQITESWRDQPLGSSKPDLKGTTHVVERLALDSYQQLIVKCVGLQHYVPWTKIKVL